MNKNVLEKLSTYVGYAAIAAFFCLVVFKANVEIKDLDLWLHMATGNHIIDQQMVPKQDIFSATVEGKDWVNHEWLFQVIVAQLHRVYGFDGITTMQVVLAALTFLLLLVFGYSRERQLGVIFVLFISFMVFQIRFTTRPDLFSLLLFALFIYLLSRNLENKTTIVLLFILQILWTSLHGFFILGPLLILLALASEGIKRHIRLPFEWNEVGRLNDLEYKHLKVILGVVVGACFLNPHFIQGALYPIKVLSTVPGESEVFFKHIRELQPPITWASLTNLQSHFFFKLLILVSFLSFFVNHKKIDVGAILLWGAILIFSLKAVRNIPFFAIAAYLTFLTNIQTVPSFVKNKSKVVPAVSLVFKILFVVCIVRQMDQLSLRGYYDFDKYERKSEFQGVSLRNFPYRAVDFLVDNNIKGKFFNDFNSGAYLIGRTYPNIKNYIDGRTEVYGAEFFNHYREIWEGDSQKFDEDAEKYQLTGAFLNYVYTPAYKGLISHLYTSKDWKLVYFDYDAAIFLKDVPEHREMIKRHKINLANWQTTPIDLVRLGATKVTPYRFVNRARALLNLGFPKKAQTEANEALRITPAYAEPYHILADVNLEKKEYTEAFENLRKAKNLIPGNMIVRYKLGLSMFHLDSLENAEKQCLKILDVYPKNAKAFYLLSRIYAKQKQYDLAMGFFYSGYASNPKLVDEIIEVAQLLNKQEEESLAQEVEALIKTEDQ